MEAKTIGIIGGTGQMGQWFKGFFTGRGHRVLISGRKTELAWQDLAEQSDVVVLSMPVPAAVKMTSLVGPLLSEEKLLMDLCSMKHEIVKAMENSTRAHVIGTHPLFGPSTDGMTGQNVILCPARPGGWLSWLENEFTATGAAVSVTDGADHDRNMAVVQALTHFVTIAFGRTLEKLGTTPQDILPYATPIFRLKLDLLGRMFAQDVELYQDLICRNPNAGEVLDMFIKSASEVNETLCLEGQGEAMMDGIMKNLGEFPATGMAESDACLEVFAKMGG